MKPDEPNPDPRTSPSHESINQSNGPSPENFPPPTQYKILGTISPVLKNSSFFVRIDNFSPLELQAQEWESNPEPGFPRAAGPEDRKTNRPHFTGIEPLQADVEEDDLPRKVDQAEEIIALSGMPITTPNGGNQATTISFMSLKSSPATNQEPTQGRGTGLQPGPMITTLEQDNQVAKLGVTTNERTPGPSAILLHLDPSPQFPWPCLSQCPDDSLEKF
ncbi:hypothetical protein DSO57_1005131 [Entomophthora muscae]|uniref:Uncharacterized protein n=1 Tax=Entomophthora muscae TaxID=34485 RepID=A0ACC2RYW0_9FUNG|nr:hypothetical protein DSO57_1005131 [Entomophthora muscae]